MSSETINSFYLNFLAQESVLTLRSGLVGGIKHWLWRAVDEQVPCSTFSCRNAGLLRHPKHSSLACWVNTTSQRPFIRTSSGVTVRRSGNYPCSTGARPSAIECSLQQSGRTIASTNQTTGTKAGRAQTTTTNSGIPYSARPHLQSSSPDQNDSFSQSKTGEPNFRNAGVA